MSETGDVPFKEYIDGQLAEVRRAVAIAADAASRDSGGPDPTPATKEYVASRLDSLQGQLDRRVETQQRELVDAQQHLTQLLREQEKFFTAVLDEQTRALDMASAEREKAASALREQTQRALDKADTEREKAASALREQTEKAASALRAETQRALDKADTEREKAASALREEQGRALTVAERERGKAAEVLEKALTERIAQGDENLRAHIDQQIGQIREALLSADSLEVERVGLVKATNEQAHQEIKNTITAVQREQGLIHEASQQAIDKSEELARERDAKANEWRGQSSDRERTQQENIQKLAAEFVRADTADVKWDEQGKQIAALTARMNQEQGKEISTQRGQDRSQPWQLWAVGVLITLVVVAVNLLPKLG